jgi:hypothetical protein
MKGAAVSTSVELTQLSIQHGETKKRNNAIAALVCGLIPAIVLAQHHPPNSARWLICAIIGLIWANGFEYSYHRWLLHRPRSDFSKGHREHHAQVGTPEEAEHVNLGRSPLDIVLMFAINAAVMIPLDLLLRLWVAPGIFVAWTVYLVVAEEIHWRIHMDGWLPPGLRFARAYHMSHHDIPTTRYNIFLPLFDWLFGDAALTRSKARV